MLACIQILVIVLRQGDLLLIVLQLEIRNIILDRLWNIFSLCPLLLTLFLLLLQLFLGLFGLSRQIFRADLPAEDASLRPVIFLYAKRNLCQDEFGLLSPLHRPESLNLQLAQNFFCRLQIALLLLDVREDLCNTSSLDFDKYLAFSDRSQRFNSR